MEHNLRWHFHSKHGAKYTTVSLVGKHRLYTKAPARSDAVVKGSFIAAEDITLAANCF